MRQLAEYLHGLRRRRSTEKSNREVVARNDMPDKFTDAHFAHRDAIPVHVAEASHDRCEVGPGSAEGVLHIHKCQVSL
jgi:hypothetical protein